MNTYIKLEAVFNYIPPAVTEDYSKTKILSDALKALRSLHIEQKYMNDIKIIEVVNGSCEMPIGIKEINRVYWMYQFNKEDADSVCESNCSTDYRPDGTACDCSECDPGTASYTCSTIYDRKVCSYRPCINCSLNYQTFFESNYLNCITPMKYVGVKNNICTKCNKSDFTANPYTFNIDTDLVFRTDMQEGYICVDYKCEPKDSSGSFLIPDSEELLDYLYKYVMKKYYENNIVMKEENSVRMYKEYKLDCELAYRKVKGKYLQRATSSSNLLKTMTAHTDTFANDDLFTNINN